MAPKRAFLLSVALVISAATVGTRSGTALAQEQAGASAGSGRLDGTWNFSTLTPLERPAEFAGRPTMSAAEAAQFEKQVMERNNADRRDGPVETDVARAYNDAWYDRGTQVAVVNGQARTSLIVEPADGRLPALTAEAAARQAARAQARRDRPADGPEDRSLAERCLSFNAGPPILPGPYNNYLQIMTFPDYVLVVNEMIHDARVIPTNGRPHLPSGMRRFLGDSVGRWEGQTLVVESTNFNDSGWITTGQNAGRLRGVPYSHELRIVERFTLVDAKTMNFEITIEDPQNYTSPFTIAYPLHREDDYRIYEYACHEGNAATELILRGARVMESEAAKSKK